MDKRIIDIIQEPVAFSAFINENMKNSTYKVAWNEEMSVEYEASKSFAELTAEYAAAMVGTVIDRNSPRPKRDMPSVGEISGTLARFGDEWQISNDRLEKYFYMEDRYRQVSKNLTETQKNDQYKNIVKYLFNPYELAAIAPHRRIWAQYLEGLSDGQVTLTKHNNEGGLVWKTALPIGIQKNILRAKDEIWSENTLETMDVISVLKYQETLANSAGKSVLKHRVSDATASLIEQCKQFRDLIGLKMLNIQTSTTPGISLEHINNYLNSIRIAPIEVVKEFGTYANGTTFSLFKDGRVVSMCAPRVAVLKVSDPLEAFDPIPNKVYTSFFDNLLSQWRDSKGRYVAYEMFAFPAFVGRGDVFILDVTKKA